MIEKLKQYKKWYINIGNETFESSSFLFHSFISPILVLLVAIVALIVGTVILIVSPIHLIIHWIIKYNTKTREEQVKDVVTNQINEQVTKYGLLFFQSCYNKHPMKKIKYFFDTNKTQRTLFDQTNSLQCDSNRRRSLGDIYRIFKYYNPNITLQELIDMLDYQVNHYNLSVSYCTTINKCVFTYDSVNAIPSCKTEFKLEDGSYATWEEIVNAFKNK